MRIFIKCGTSPTCPNIHTVQNMCRVFIHITLNHQDMSCKWQHVPFFHTHSKIVNHRDCPYSSFNHQELSRTGSSSFQTHCTAGLTRISYLRILCVPVRPEILTLADDIDTLVPVGILTQVEIQDRGLQGSRWTGPLAADQRGNTVEILWKY